ncbi:hypothetical protein [Lysobacter gummosus]|uniref:hypothetical protein n=1 Tax=Lysobacter gummosus TaxID=262324 RepID=UPI003632067C
MNPSPVISRTGASPKGLAPDLAIAADRCSRRLVVLGLRGGRYYVPLRLQRQADCRYQ